MSTRRSGTPPREQSETKRVGMSQGWVSQRGVGHVTKGDVTKGGGACHTGVTTGGVTKGIGHVTKGGKPC